MPDKPVKITMVFYSSMREDKTVDDVKRYVEDEASFDGFGPSEVTVEEY